MNNIRRGRDGNFHMNNKGLWKQNHRPQGTPRRDPEKKCWECGSQSWRVEGLVCIKCGLPFEEECIELEIPTLKSSQGTFEDKF